MTWSERYSQVDKPDSEQIAEHVDSPLWQEFCDFVEANYATQPKIEYSVCSAAPGWNVKYKASGRALCTLYPHEGFFTCLICIGTREVGEAEAILTTCCSYLQELFQNARPMNGTRWLMIDITSEAVLEDAKRLLGTRAPQKRMRTVQETDR
jgi:hypothetical protein